MPVQRPFRFGVVFPGFKSYADLIEKAQKAEQLGYNIFYLTDHLEIAELSPSVTLMAVASATEKIRIGSFVFNNDFRHPVLLAKDVATLDLLSGGRFELGIGPGYLSQEYERAGIVLDRPGIRIERMTEGLQIIKQFFEKETISFSGKYYNVNGLKGVPKVVQKPYPPIYIGGGGKKILSLAAREANIIGFTAIVKSGEQGFDTTSLTAEATTEKVEWVREAAGERFQELEINSFVILTKITEQREIVAQHIAARMNLKSEQVLKSPHCLVGNIEQISEDIQLYRKLYGISSFTILGDSMEVFAPVIDEVCKISF